MMWLRICLVMGLLTVSLGLHLACGPSNSCSFVCEPLQRRCIKEGLLLCSQSATSGCYDWGLVSCHPGKTCQKQGDSFACVGDSSVGPSGNCKPIQARKACVGEEVYWFDKCNQRGELVEACVNGKVCKEGACVTGQSSNCGSGQGVCARGERRCAGVLVQNCQWDAQNSCGVWAAPQSCAAGSCFGGREWQRGQTCCLHPCT